MCGSCGVGREGWWDLRGEYPPRCGSAENASSVHRVIGGEARTPYRSRHTWDAAHTSRGPTETSTFDVFCLLLRKDKVMSSRHKTTVKRVGLAETNRRTVVWAPTPTASTIIMRPSLPFISGPSISLVRLPFWPVRIATIRIGVGWTASVAAVGRTGA